MRGYYERRAIKTARELVEENGPSLVGRTVNTAPLGSWPGGLAEVTEIAPDKNAPEIAFQVRALRSNVAVRDAVAAGHLDDESIGVFHNEEVQLI